MRAAILVLFAVLLQMASSSQTPPAGLVLEDLRDWLKTNWYDSDFSDLGYSAARQQMYSFTDEVGGNIACIYTGFQQPAEFTTFPDPINAEHLVPQSFYGSASPMRSDIHNLRPAHGSVNSARANYPYSEVADANAFWYGVDGSGNYQSTSTQPANAEDFSERYNSVWEPREERKGDVARQLFYFFTMYPTQAGDISLIASVSLLYTWHLDDPVSAAELTRNDRIETAQGNRNPYIDHPELAYDAWLWVAVDGCIDDTACNYDAAANTDDGSCLFVGDACDDGDATTTGEEITASCTCAVVDVLGCTDPLGCNYDPAATVNDGLCDFAACAGCMDNTACNYDATATLADVCTYPGDPCDDGDAATTGEVLGVDCSCAVPNVPGCTYDAANNYNPVATLDDGSCTFDPCTSVGCDGADVNGSGQVGTGDLLAVLASFGAACD